MSRYLSKKAAKNRGWEIAVCVVCLCLGGIAVTVCAEEFSTREFLVDLLASALLIVAVTWPILPISVRRLRQRRARKMAKKLEAAGVNQIPLDRLDEVTGMRDSAEKLGKLIGLDYFTGVGIDLAHSVVTLAGAPEPEKQPPEPDAFEETLHRIRALNDAIDDAPVSRRIERIEQLTAGIFEAIRRNPEKGEEARRFVNYYLPTTLKLLQTYSLMEKQSYQGENIQTSRRRIEEMLDRLVGAIERQQDKLFKADALDVETDIQVLETMMTSDGLLHGK